MAVPLLAELNIPGELIFVLVAGIITLISKMNEKAKKAREESIRKERVLDRAERMVLPGNEPAIRMPSSSPAPPLIVVERARTVSAPAGVGGSVPKRTRRRRAPPPSPVRTRPDEHYARQTTRTHPIVARLRRSRQALREAILLREILGPPVAMRGRHRPGQW